MPNTRPAWDGWMPSSPHTANGRDKRFAGYLAYVGGGIMLPFPSTSDRLNVAYAGNGATRGTLMKFELREASPGYLVLTCRGGLSWEDRELLAASVEQYLVGNNSLRGVVLEMSGVEFVNSAGLGALFQLIQRLRGRGGALAFASVPPTIGRLLTTVGMERLAKFGQDVPEALTLLGQADELVRADSDEQPGA